MDKNMLIDLFYVQVKSSKKRIWFYQYEGGVKQRIIKENKYWYNAPDTKLGSIGSDALEDAKEDNRYMGGKVWSELI